MAQAQIRGQLTRDGLSLSRRFWRNHRRFADQARRQIVASARAGESIQRIAERLLDQGDPVVRLPQHVVDLRDAARLAATGDPTAVAAYEEAVQRWSGRIRRLGQGGRAGGYTVRSATQRLVKDLRGATAEQVDRAVDRWVLERARHQARTVARHETVEAYRAAYQATSRQNPAVVGYRWTLSGRHPRPDVCDILANQDLHGLGPGGYPANEVPDTPHTNCLCVRVAITDRSYFRRQLARETGAPEPPKPWESGRRETGEEWVLRQPREMQDALLGPTRARILRDPDDPRRVLDGLGHPIPVHQVLGLPPPVRRDGPAVRAQPIIRRDRAAGQVRPFPSAPPLDEPPVSPPPAAPATPIAAAAPAPPTRPPSRARRLRDLGYADDVIERDAREEGLSRLDRAAVRAIAEETRPAWERMAEGQAIGTAEQWRLRRGMRRLLRTADPDFGSRDVLDSRPLANIAGTLGPREARRSNGIHSASGMAAFAKRTLKAAGQALRRLARGAAPTENQWRYLGTLVHEELHGATPLGRGAYVPSSLRLEEAMVEMRTRQVLREVARAIGKESPFGVPRAFSASSGGVGVANLVGGRSYENLVRGLVRASSEATGLMGEELDAWLEERVRKWFQIAPPDSSLTSPDEYIRGLAGLLHPENPARMEELLREHVR